MKLKPFEIDIIIDYYTNDVEYLTHRLNRIQRIADFGDFDDDLRGSQIDRIRTQIDETNERIKEIEEFKKEL